MSDELYQARIVALAKSKTGAGKLAAPTKSARRDNPLCGDRVTVYLKVENGTIKDVSFQGAGCAISKASASLMTESVKGKTIQEATALFERFQRMITAPADSPTESLGKLTVLAGVRQFPVRVKCATLAWHTLRSAVDVPGGVVSTE